MKRHTRSLTCVILIALNFITSVAQASEMGVPSIKPPKTTISDSSFKLKRFDNHLKESDFLSSVSHQQNDWRSVVRSQGGSSKIALKTGEWDRPDSDYTSELWLSYNGDWASVATGGKTLRFSYTFGKSNPGVLCRFRFGASAQSRKAYEGDYALSLIYGETSCTFSVKDKDSSGSLPTPIDEGSTVIIDLHPNNTASITIDDQLILDGQVVDLDQNFISLVAIDTQAKYSKQPKILYLQEFKVSLER
ncbi:hypothetical protein QEH59_18040 [Coraliomargarita sp. SDUM461004]|uniref:Uncharacterized protein n=1 Tax=Thalassobacterium sedimentorum TaxID=3041258 RepID=A0ABU1ANP7_9BACT|nr:hypothetical protein [Coraliomargarita sp. SDUM461004]MDQ8196342.1 hypothetical protein [Coraliomargarita sp. SDUM461004]